MTVTRVRLGGNGRLIIPTALRRELALEPGQTVVLESTDGELRLRSLAAAVRHAQALVRRRVPADVLLSEELIEERRREARREAEGDTPGGEADGDAAPPRATAAGPDAAS